MPMWMRWACVCMALVVMAAVVGAAAWQRQALQRSWQEGQRLQHQTLAETWAQLLTVRLDAQQRTVAALAEALPPAASAEQVALVHAWMAQSTSVLRTLEGVYVVDANGAARAFAARVQGPAPAAGGQALSMAQQQAVQAALADGKPRIHTQAQPDAGAQLLLVAPLRTSAAGTPPGALAVRLHWPSTWLVPSVPSGLALQLRGPMGQLLAHSGHAASPPVPTVPAAALQGAQLAEQGAMASAALPQAQWKVWVLGNMPALPWYVGAPSLVLGLGALALWAAAVAARQWQRSGRAGAQLGEGAHTPDGAPAAGAPPALLAPERSDRALPTYGRSLLDMSPVPLLAVQGQTLRLCNVHVLLLLGYSSAELEGQHVSVLFADVAALLQAERQVREQIHHRGSYSGLLQLCRRDGSTLAVQLQAQWLPSEGPYTLWRLRPPAAQWRRHVWPTPEVAAAHTERDALTGVPNRMALGWQLQAWAGQAVPAGGPPATGVAWAQLPSAGCLMVLDVDHLGALNEVASRSFGDSVLAHVAQLLHGLLRSVGWVARLGGDEFVVVLPGLSLAHATTVGQRLCAAVQQWRPLWREEVHTVSISAGVVALDVLRHDVQQALRAADLACYEAKRRGRGQVAAGQVSNAQALRTHTLSEDGQRAWP